MLYGSANRWKSDNTDAAPSATEPFDPRLIWSLWDTLDISTTTMYARPPTHPPRATVSIPTQHPLGV